MLEQIKLMMGISNTSFDAIINSYIASAKKDLIGVGIDSTIVNTGTDALIVSAINSYCLSLLDVDNAEMYANSYAMQKDTLRRLVEYQ